MKCPSFVWLRGMKGPRGSVWFVPQTKDMKPITPLQSHDLTPEEAELTIDQLAAKYPYTNPVAPIDPKTTTKKEAETP